MLLKRLLFEIWQYFNKIVISWWLLCLVLKEFLLSTEAVVWRCSVKTVLLKISRNSQENTCMGVCFFNKVAACQPASLSKKWIRWTSANGCFCADWKHFCFVKKFFYFTFFHQSWNLPLLNYSGVNVGKSNEACIASKPSI